MADNGDCSLLVTGTRSIYAIPRTTQLSLFRPAIELLERWTNKGGYSWKTRELPLTNSGWHCFAVAEATQSWLGRTACSRVLVNGRRMDELPQQQPAGR